MPVYPGALPLTPFAANGEHSVYGDSGCAHSRWPAEGNLPVREAVSLMQLICRWLFNMVDDKNLDLTSGRFQFQSELLLNGGKDGCARCVGGCHLLIGTRRFSSSKKFSRTVSCVDGFGFEVPSA